MRSTETLITLLECRFYSCIEVDGYYLYYNDSDNYYILRKEFRKRVKTIAKDMTLEVALEKLAELTKD